MTDLYKLSAVELTRKIKSREILVSDIAKVFVQRIKEVNPLINAIQQFDAELIIEASVNADKLLLANCKIGKLFGLPLAIKDAFHIKGFICSKGSLGLYNTSAKYDATVVARLKKAGAHIYGITNTSELLLSYESNNLVYGKTKNPYDLSRTPGGSSGGSAAIIAVGGVPISIGNDAGGSLRQPAHYCGICTHKPTHGLIPTTGNYPVDGYGIAAQLVAIGPMARYVEDLILMMEVMSGSDGIDPHSVPIKYSGKKVVDLKQLKIAYFYDNPGGTFPTQETIKAIDIVVELLKPKVNQVREIYPPILNEVHRLHFETIMLGGDSGQSLKQLIDTFKNKKISPLTYEFLELANQSQFSVTELRQRFVELERFRYKMNLFMKDYDIIISPVSATPAKKHGETFANVRDFGYITAHNLTGWPATVLPCVISNEGLPIGVQLVSKPWQDYVSLNVALYLQKIIGVFPIPQINNKQVRDMVYD
ncbi:MAG: amidase [Legionella sp.]|nr:amidase [Legionella sp.]